MTEFNNNRSILLIEPNRNVRRVLQLACAQHRFASRDSIIDQAMSETYQIDSVRELVRCLWEQILNLPAIEVAAPLKVKPQNSLYKPTGVALKTVELR